MLLYLALPYRSDLTVTASALSSGYSSEVHGLFTVTSSTSSGSSSGSSGNSNRSGSIKSGNSGKANYSNDDKSGNSRSSDSDCRDRIESLGSSASAHSSVSAIRKQTMHYKALDSGVKCCLSTA